MRHRPPLAARLTRTLPLGATPSPPARPDHENCESLRDSHLRARARIQALTKEVACLKQQQQVGTTAPPAATLPDSKPGGTARVPAWPVSQVTQLQERARQAMKVPAATRSMTSPAVSCISPRDRVQVQEGEASGVSSPGSIKQAVTADDKDARI